MDHDTSALEHPDSQLGGNSYVARETPSITNEFADDWMDDDEFANEHDVAMELEGRVAAEHDREEDLRHEAHDRTADYARAVDEPHHVTSEPKADDAVTPTTATARSEVSESAAAPPAPHPPVATAGPITSPVLAADTRAPAVTEHPPASSEARQLLKGIAESLRTLGSRGEEANDGGAVAIFPRGVNLLEVRLHLSRDQAIDLNFRVAGSTTNA